MRSVLIRRTVLLTILSISIFILSLLLAACGATYLPPIEPTDIARLPTPRQTVTPATKNVLVISIGWSNEWKRNFNPFSFNSLFIGYPFLESVPYQSNFSGYLIYEPLMIYDQAKGEIVPWLATEYEWSEGNRTLTFRIRKGVEWSDGTPFNAQDVLFTFEMLQQHPEITGYASFPHPTSKFLDETVQSISAPEDFKVVFTFKQADTLGLYHLISVPIIPKHLWENVANPANFENPDPVGTGPFTQVTVCDKDVWFDWYWLQLERNPNYWQKGRPYLQGIKYYWRGELENRIPEFLSGQYEISFETDQETAQEYADKDPQNYHSVIYKEGVVFLRLNTARSPLNNKDVRKASSMAINREQIVNKVLHEVTLPANAVGLGDNHKPWWSEEAIRAGTWTEYDPEEAESILDRLGFLPGRDGIRLGPDGTRLKFSFIVKHSPYGTPDNPVAQMIADQLRQVGIEVVITPIESDWLYFFRVGDYDLAILAWNDSLMPNGLYWELMSADGKTLRMEDAKSNAEAGRYSSEEADRLLGEFVQESDPARQKAIMDQVQALFVEDAPALPLYQNYSFFQYNTQRFTGFPEGEAFQPTDLLTLLNVEPR